MDAYASVEELEKRWRELTVIEKERATALLLDATVLIASMCERSGVTIDTDNEVQQMALTATCCNAVKRAMQTPIDQAPMSNYSQSAGGYSESATYVNSTGDLYLTSNEKKMLGIGRQYAFSVRPMIGTDDD